jgi:hypothetical protein
LAVETCSAPIAPPLYKLKLRGLVEVTLACGRASQRGVALGELGLFRSRRTPAR